MRATWHFDNTKQLFECARDAAIDAERCKRQIEAIESRYVHVGGGSMEPRATATPDPDSMPNRIVTLMDKERALQRRQDEDFELVDLACAVLYGRDNETGLSVLVPSWWCDVLWWRYLAYESWERVGEVVGYSPHRCWEVAQLAFEIADGWGIAKVMQGIGAAEQ